MQITHRGPYANTRAKHHACSWAENGQLSTPLPSHPLHCKGSPVPPAPEDAPAAQRQQRRLHRAGVKTLPSTGLGPFCPPKLLALHQSAAEILAGCQLPPSTSTPSNTVFPFDGRKTTPVCRRLPRCKWALPWPRLAQEQKVGDARLSWVLPASTGSRNSANALVSSSASPFSMHLSPPPAWEKAQGLSVPCTQLGIW